MIVKVDDGTPDQAPDHRVPEGAGAPEGGLPDPAAPGRTTSDRTTSDRTTSERSVDDRPLDVRPVHARNGRVIAALGLLAGVLLVYVAGGWWFPRWWSEKIANACDGQFGVAVPLGLGLGAVSAAVTLLALREVARTTRSWTPSYLFLVVAVVALSPIVLTLQIVLGGGETAQSASITLDQRAPGFTPALFLGALIGVGLVLAAWRGAATRRRLRNEIIDLRERLEELKVAQAAPAPAERGGKGRDAGSRRPDDGAAPGGDHERSVDR